MLEVTYDVVANFSLKRYKDGHLSSRSYPYATTSSIRGSLLGAMIKRRGRKFAEENFHHLKNVQIFTQFPNNYKGSQHISRLFNSTSYAIKNNKVGMTVGIREYISTPKIVFYIDETLEDVIEYLENISRIGNSESLVNLTEIKKVTEMNNILMDWNQELGFDLDIFEDFDWDKSRKGLQFKHIYLFSGSRDTKYLQKKCYIKDFLKITTLESYLSTE